MNIMKSRESFIAYIRSIYARKNYDNMFIISVDELVGEIQDGIINIEDNFQSINMQAICDITINYLKYGDIYLVNTANLVQSESFNSSTLRYSSLPSDLVECDILIDKRELNVVFKKDSYIICVVMSVGHEIGNKISYLQMDCIYTPEQIFAQYYEFSLTGTPSTEFSEKINIIQEDMNKISILDELEIQKKINVLSTGNYKYYPTSNKLILDQSEETSYYKTDINYAYDIYIHVLNKLVKLLQSMEVIKKNDE